VGYGNSQGNVTHALTADDTAGDANATLITDNVLVANALVFTTVAFPVLGRSENFLAEQTVFFGLLSTIVDRFRFGYFTV